MHKQKTDHELKQLALQYVGGGLFTSLEVPEQFMKRDLPRIFLALGFMQQDVLDAVRADEPYMFYEYMQNAMSRKYNGYPIFPNALYLTKDEFPRFVEYVNMLIDFQQTEEPVTSL